MAKHYFGTDGIRGPVGQFPITADFVLNIGWAVGMALGGKSNRTKILIGKDTRISGYMIESALEAGLSAAGVDTQLLGCIPTPAIAYLTKALRATAGIVISASHNPYEDNGIKLFSSEGFKLADETLKAIEAQLEQPMKTTATKLLGKAERVHDASGRYVEYCKSSVPHQLNLNGLKIVLDCSNGATYHVAPQVFGELGANLVIINASPNGLNINENCGSNHPEVLCQHVKEEKAHVGIAFDGDGDRVIMVDENGDALDGDEILYIIANGLMKSKLLVGGVIGTEMSNRGLEMALNDIGIAFHRVPVGDQHIIESLRQKNWQLGGEPSGHIIYLHVNTTADGIIAALQVLQTMVSTGKTLAELRKNVKKLPSAILNIPHNGHKIELNDIHVKTIIEDSKIKLGPYGKINLRYSGTEPVMRLMVEGEDDTTVNNVINDIADHLKTLIQQKARLSHD